ncbi:MAG: DUF3037 domain-containing protein [Verrucomicrobiales bacterium]|nr:DUF3037 domain-containing protein [Verrucomicrobiales bacterium]
MPEKETICAYRILRYAPNLLRDEHANIGVLLHEPARGRLEMRLLESEGEFARLRRLHPAADLQLLRALEAELRAQAAAHEGGAAAWLEKLDQTWSGAIQMSPQRAVITEDFEAELDRIYRDQVEPVRGARAADRVHSRAGIRARANEIFRRTGIHTRMKHNVGVEEFTYAGDPMRFDYAYRKNGTQGFVQTLALERDPAQAKALAFTSERIRAKAASAEFTAITDTTPQRDNARHRFVSDLLADEEIRLVPLPNLEGWARDLGNSL